MPEVILPLFSNLESRDGTLSKDAHCTNVLLDKNEGEGGPVTRKRFGLSSEQVGTAVNTYGILYSEIAPTKIFHVAISGGNPTLFRNGVSVGAVSLLLNGRTSFTEALPYGKFILSCVSTSTYYIYTEVGTVVTSASPAQAMCAGGAYLDGYFTYGTTGNRLYTTDNGDFTTTNALSYLEVDETPQYVFNHHNYVGVITRHKTYFYYNAGNPTGSPFSPVENNTLSYGILHAGTFSYLDNKAIWVAGKIGDPKVVVLENNVITEIQTPDIAAVIKNNLSMAVLGSNCYTTTNRGHDLYVMCLGTGAPTLVYDFFSRMWSVFGYNNTNDFSVVGFWGTSKAINASTIKNYFMGKSNDTIYISSPTVYQDAGTAITCEIISGKHDGNIKKKKFLSSLEILGDKQASSSLTLSYSDNDYASFITGRSIDLSINRSRLSRLGSFYRRAFKLTHSSNTPLALESIIIEVEPGNV